MQLIRPSFEILTDINGDRILKNIESIGRTCYKSEDKITPDSAGKFVKRIIKSGHHSVIEHENITARLIVDRGVSHEIIRHRLVSYSQESTRYCNYKKGVTFIIPPWVNIREGEFPQGDPNLSSSYKTGTWLSAMMHSEATYLNLLRCGWSPQQARSVLPNSLKTEVVMTANLREWMHIFKLRCHLSAQPQMVEIMVPLRDKFREMIPIIFDQEID